MTQDKILKGGFAGLKNLHDKIYREFFYVPKHAKVSKRVLKTRTTLSLLTILACCIIFCSTTFAWFTSNQHTAVSPITAASYSLTIVIDGTTIGTSDNKSSISYTCPLAAEDRHTVTFAPTGTAQTGYCVINAGGKTCSIVQIHAGESLSLTIRAAVGETITFSANWGEYQNSVAAYSVREGDGYHVFENGDCIEVSSTPYETYMVAEGATLEMIAEHYGVSAEEILNFNNITELAVGETIKIPNPKVPEPFELPGKEPTTEPPEETAAPSDTAEGTEPSTKETTEPPVVQTTAPQETEAAAEPEPTAATEPPLPEVTVESEPKPEEECEETP